MVWLSGQVFQMGQMPQLRKIINSLTTPLNQVGVLLVSVFLVVRGHEISGNLIKDVFAGAGIRVNTVFAGHNFDLNDSGIKIHDNTILRSGTTNDLYTPSWCD